MAGPGARSRGPRHPLTSVVSGCLGGGRAGSGGSQDLPLSSQHLHSCDAGVSIRWQVVDERIPLYANHKAILQKVAALFGAYY